MILTNSAIPAYVQAAVTQLTNAPSSVLKISNKPNTQIERYVVVMGFKKDDMFQTFVAPLKVFYFDNEIDVTAQYAQPKTQFLYTDNTILQIVRDENLQPVPNPNYSATIPDPTDSTKTIPNPDTSDASKYETIPGFDMINQILTQNKPIIDQLDGFITINDQLGNFDIY